VAKGFGGGGHKNASGCTVEGPYEDARRVLVARLSEAMALTAAPPAR
jgi:nanoRNase/pAp phosphatase (c-di-AMP/oligoRNAs hydrolase)